MLKDDMLEVIEKFERETWKYDESHELDNDMSIIDKISQQIEQANDEELGMLFSKLKSIIGIMRYKYGFESKIINTNKELQEIVESISLEDNEIVEKYNNLSEIYEDYLSKINNLDFIDNKHKNIQGKEGMFLAIESLKSLITNKEYKDLLSINQINSIITDCIKLNEEKVSIETLENKYKEIINMIWEKSLSNGVESHNFQVLFSNISGGTLDEQSTNLINRQEQSSCSLITSDFIATYGSDTRRIGFIYPNTSNIINASAYDLSSNVFGTGVINTEKGTKLVTPFALEHIGIELTKEEDNDMYFSKCYNEVLVNSKPCGILIIGLGEKELNVEYEDAIELSKRFNIPLYTIDTMEYRNELSERDKFYIAYNFTLLFFNLKSSNISVELDNQIMKIAKEHQEEIVKTYVSLKNNNILDKEVICEQLKGILSVYNINNETTI